MARILIIVCFTIFPSLLFSQKSIDGDFRKTPLSQVITFLETQHQLIFSYTNDLIEEETVDISFHGKSINQALELIFEKTSIDFEIINETYIVLTAREIELLSICGTIQTTDGSPLSFANILSLKTLNGTSVDENGRFNWADKILPSDTIEISYVAHQTRQITASQLLNCPVISLKSESFSFSEIIVKEYVTSGIEQSEELDHVILNPDKISVVPGLTEADVLQMVQILPGVQSLDESATGLHIHGGTPDQNLILWDDIPVYNSGHFFGMISAFNPYIVDNVKVYRNGFPAEYGGRVSGVIDIQGVQEIPDQIQANVGINFTHADASATIPLFNKKSALVLSARRAYTDIIQSPTYNSLSQRVFQKGKINETQGVVEEEEEDIDFNLAFNFNDLNAKWIWKPNERNDLAFSVFKINDKLDFFIENFEDNIQSTDNVNSDNIGWSAKWKRQWNSNVSSKALVTYSKVNNDLKYTIGDQDTSRLELNFTQLNNIQDLTLKLDNQWDANNNFTLNFGYQMSDLELIREWIFQDDDSDEILEKNILHTGHLTLISRLNNQFRINTGIRMTYASAHGELYPDPRLSLFYVPNKKWQFKATAGQYHQFINQAIELNDLGLNQENWVLAENEEDVPITKNQHFSTGLLHNAGSFQFELEAYYKRLTGLTSISPVFLDSFQEDEQAEGTGTAWGIDLLLKKRIKKYETWLSYSYGRVFYTFDIFNNFEAFAAPHDRPHSLTSMHQYKYKDWNFSLSWKFASGKVYTTADDFFMEEDEVFPDYNYDQINENRLPVFHRLDASILYKFNLKENRIGGIIGLSALNIYNRRNILSREYLAFYEDEEEEYILEALDRPMLLFTPNIVFRLSWK